MESFEVRHAVAKSCLKAFAGVLFGNWLYKKSGLKHNMRLKPQAHSRFSQAWDGLRLGMKDGNRCASTASFHSKFVATSYVHTQSVHGVRIPALPAPS